MMDRMTRRRDRRAGAAVVLLLLAGGLSACSGDAVDPPPPPETARRVALRVTTVAGAESLDETARTELETEVGDVLSEYVVRGFLGDYPREDFVRAFDSFTGGAARSAAEDLDVLTANRYESAEGVQATGLTARLSVLASGSTVYGASAAVRFAFTAALPGGESAPVRLSGRLMLVSQDGAWSVFGYDVARSDAGAVEAEVSS